MLICYLFLPLRKDIVNRLASLYDVGDISMKKWHTHTVRIICIYSILGIAFIIICESTSRLTWWLLQSLKGIGFAFIKICESTPGWLGWLRLQSLKGIGIAYGGGRDVQWLRSLGLLPLHSHIYCLICLARIFCFDMTILLMPYTIYSF